MTDQTRLVGFTEKRTGHGVRSGSHYPDSIPVEDVEAFFDYDVERVTPQLAFGNGIVKDGDHVAVRRGDTGHVFGYFKPGYKIHQPKEWLLGNLDLLLDGGLEIASASQVKSGAIAFVQTEMPETRVAGESVQHRPYLGAATSHDGSLATRYWVGTELLACTNQLGLLKRGKLGSTITIRHSANSLLRIGDPRESLGLVVEQVGDAFDQQIRELTDQYVSDAEWREFVHAYSGLWDDTLEGRARTIAERKASILNGLWSDDPRAAPWRNSAYGVVAAVNTAAHHEFTVKGDREDRNDLRTVNGAWEKVDERTLKLLSSVA